FEHVNVTRLTSEGRVVNASTSPDGKYLAYVLGDPGQLSLWVKQSGTATSVQLIPPADVRYEELVFSHDNGWIYYVRDEDLFQIPTLGGQPRRLISGVGSPVSISPDGKRVAFIRSSTERGESYLMLADSDGSNQTTLSIRRAPGYYRAPAWS